MSFAKTLRAYKGMTMRNIKVYLKDKMAIIFSMMTQIIVLGLYLLFIKQSNVDSITAGLGELSGMVTDEQIQALANSWLLSGVIGSSVVTVALNSLTTMISDKQNKIDFDYTASSVSGGTVVMSYFSGAVASTVVISAILLTAGLIFLTAAGAQTLTFAAVVKSYALVILGSVSSTMILMLIASFFKKNSTFTAFNTLVSAAIGFIIGAYMPVSQFSDGVQNLVNLVPGSHIAALLRNVLVSPCIEDISNTLNGLDSGAFAESANDTFAVKLNLFGKETGVEFMLIYSAAVIVLFLALNLVTYRFSSKRKS